MVPLAKSMVRLPWAASVFGVQQLVNLLSDSGRQQAEGAIYSATEAVTHQFATSPLAFGAYQLGDEAQRQAVDLLWDVLEFQVLRPEWLTRSAGQIAERSLDAVRALTPGGNLESSIDVLRNTFGVINLVNGAGRLLDLPPGPIDLGAAIERAYSFGDYAPLWLVEGLGEAYADQEWSDVTPVRGLLTDGQGAALPEKSLLMMHAGMGISFAQHLIRPLTPVTPKRDIAAALERFSTLVRANARDGYEGPAFESLGLVTRTWYAPMTPLIDELLWTIDLSMLEFFWHGVGRSIYFTPAYLIPGNNALRGVQSEAPHELALLNGTAGAAWAFALVNIRQPEILLNLVRNDSKLLSTNDAFTNGLTSVVIMANDMLPGDPYTAALCGYRPSCACTTLSATWDRLVRSPCQRAAQEYYPQVKKHGRLGEIFRYQDLHKLAQRSRGPVK
jgi:hypothetical protein